MIENKLIDVTVPMRPRMPQWDGEEVFAATPLSRTPDDVSNVLHLTMTSHTGTHVDAPRHFIHDGATLDQIPLDRWVGPCLVVDFAALDQDITADDLMLTEIPDGTERLIFKTRNSALWSSSPDAFVHDYIALAPSGAEWLVESNVGLLGIDYLSIGSVRPDGVETHLTLLGNGVVIVEGLNLSTVAAGHYELLCFPLNLAGSDGAPARVALRPLMS